MLYEAEKDGKLVVDNSILVGVEQCNLYGLMKYVWGLRMRDVGMDAANVGTSVHEALAVHFEGQGFDKVMRVWRESYVGLFGDRVPEEARLGWENVGVILEEWLKAHPVERFPFVVEKGLVDIGYVVGLDAGGEFYFFAKEDLPVRDKLTGLPWVCDHKTRKLISSWWVREFKNGSQISGYIWAAGKRTKEMVPGGYLNVIELGMLPTANKKCSVHKVKYVECRRFHAKWQLFTLSRCKEVLDVWHRDALAAARKYKMLRKVYPNVGYAKAVPRQGQFTGACKFCEFVKWCSAGLPERMLGEMQEERWNPWQMQEVKTYV